MSGNKTGYILTKKSDSTTKCLISTLILTNWPNKLKIESKSSSPSLTWPETKDSFKPITSHKLTKYKIKSNKKMTSKKSSKTVMSLQLNTLTTIHYKSEIPLYQFWNCKEKLKKCKEIKKNLKKCPKKAQNNSS